MVLVFSQRRMLLNLWIAFEKQHYSRKTFPECAPLLSELQSKLPQQVKKRRKLYPEDPEDLTMEEYIDYIFPEDEDEEKQRRGVGGVGKLLALARQWKETQAKIDESLGGAETDGGESVPVASADVTIEDVADDQE